MLLMYQACLKVSFHQQLACNSLFHYVVYSVLQRFKDRELIAPVTPPSQVFTSLSSKPPADDVSVAVEWCIGVHSYCLSHPRVLV